MSIVEILIISLALSMDAFAVTITNLLVYQNLSRARQLAMPLTFGVFQGLMLLIGFFAGYLALGFIEAYAGPVAMVILFVIGGRMIFEAIRDMRKKKAELKDGNEQEGKLDATETPESLETPEAVESLEASETPGDTVVEKAVTLTLPTILAQGVATSLDALIVGVSLAALATNIYIAAPMVGVTTFLICLLGLVIGKRLGALLGSRAQLIGGVILILIGIKVCFF